MLIGEYQHTIDAKNRVIVPAKFREDLGSSFYITKGLYGCLFVLSRKGWSSFRQKLMLCRFPNPAVFSGFSLPVPPRRSRTSRDVF